MKKLGVVCSLLVTVSTLFAACGSDDAKNEREGDGGGGAGGAGSPSAAGSGFMPQGGDAPSGGGDGGASSSGGSPVAEGGGPVNEGGRPVSEGGAPIGEGGMPGAGAAGAAGASEGGAPTVDCGTPGTFTYSCGEVSELWNPVYAAQLGYFELDVSGLPYPIVSGTVDWTSTWADGINCGTANVTPNGSTVRATPNVQQAPTAVRLRDFHLVDACGNQHDFDPIGVPNCSELTGSGNFGTWNLSCTSRFDATCPDTCD